MDLARRAFTHCFSTQPANDHDLENESIPSRNPRTQGQQLFLDALVTALDHVGVLHGGFAAGAQGRTKQRHAGADVG